MRVSDALIMLASIEYFGLEAVLGVTVGCAIANLASMYGPPDIVVGSLANLVASLTVYYVCRVSRRAVARVLSSIAASVIIAVIIGYVVIYMIAGIPNPLVAVLFILAGELVAITVLGTLLAEAVERRLKHRLAIRGA